MTCEDEADYEKFLDGIAYFLKLDVQQTMEHIREHKEDSFCNIRHFSGTGSALCTKEGMRALQSLIRRRVQAKIDGKNLAFKDVVDEVCKHIGPGLREGTEQGHSQEDIFERVYSGAVKTVEEQQKEFKYHFPCVLTGAKSPEEFSIGPVSFTRGSLFESRLLALGSEQKKLSEKIRDAEFLDYVKRFGWICSVEVPRCSSKVSKQRAELAARTAINIVRVWFGLGHGRRMRLVHTEPATSGFSKFLVEDDKEISLNWSRTFEGAAVINGWFDQVVPGNIGHHKIASSLLKDIVYEQRSDIVERLIDALSWFGDAAFEPSPGAKIAKLVILLERLTMTAPKFAKRRFCRRVAILAMDDETDLAAKYWSAYSFHNARSGIVHGSKSQFTDDHWRELRQVQNLITKCLFRAMEVYSLITFGPPNLARTLDAFFNQQENRREDVFKILDAELVAKDKARAPNKT